MNPRINQDDKRKKAKRIEKGLSNFLAAISITDFLWRVVRYIGNILHLFTQTVKTWITSVADYLDIIALGMETYLFYKDKEKDLEKFSNKLFLPTLLITLSTLMTFGVIAITTVLGVVASTFRVAFQTISRGFSLFRILTIGKTNKLSHREEKAAQEEIYSDMIPMRTVLASAFLVIGAIGVGLGSAGIGLVVVAGVYLGSLVIYKTINHFFPEAIPTAAKWIRRHEPLFIKKMTNSIKTAYQHLRDKFSSPSFTQLRPKEHIFSDIHGPIEKKVKTVDIAHEKKKAKTWGLTAATLAKARIKQPRHKNKILQDINIHIEVLNEKIAQLENKNKFQQWLLDDRYMQRKAVLLQLKTLLEEMDHQNIDTIKQELKSIYRDPQFRKAFSSLTFGMGPVLALLKETKSLVKENIHDRIEKYKQNHVLSDREYYTKKLDKLAEARKQFQGQNQLEYGEAEDKTKNMLSEVSGFNEHLIDQQGIFSSREKKINQRLAYLNTNKQSKENSIIFLQKVNKKVDELINYPNSYEIPDVNIENDMIDRITIHHLANPMQFRKDLNTALCHIDPEFKQSLRGNGERAQIVEAIINKIDRHYGE